MRIYALVFIFSIIALSAKAEDSKESPFILIGSDAQQLCIEAPSVCEIWVNGVIEGMEFLHLLGTSETNNMFCFDNFGENIKQIRLNFTDYIAKEENTEMLKQPAVISLMLHLDQYRCP